ncbi:hypothetical protein PAXRUDRAFT_158863 [Paxillus rubicundulus Ve08.2h10]|uniref:DUF6830 domain-containing protein n=1 Tax=Paxillus rubicundulus Ve08.2h10 TaxID=930991 RepID=A0A0D0CXS4_9AGAM|nr:hypothetical protein PAXRUDRAFT_158863 [Paxillus rubicundulus Ve08.2h10]
MIGWVRRALPKNGAETQFTAPCPVQNYFLKGIISNDSCTALHDTIKCDLLSMSTDDIQQQYCLPDFTSTFCDYLHQCANKADINKALHMPLKVWFKFWVQLLSVHNGRMVMPSQVVQGYPPSEKIPLGTVIWCSPTPLNNPSNAMVCTLQCWTFILHSHFFHAPATLPPWLLVLLLYIQFFQLVHPEADMGMWIADQQFCLAADQTIVRLSGVILLTEVSHPVELIPIYGTSLDHTVTAETSIQIYSHFYLNDFNDKEMYHMLQNLDTTLIPTY